MSDISDDQVFDPIEGEGNESVQPADDKGEESPESQTDSAEDATVETPTEKGADDGGEASADESKEGEKDGDKDAEKPVDKPDEKPDEDDADKLLADPKAPNYFKNYIKNVAQPKIAAAKELEMEIETLGGLEDIKSKVQLYDSIGTTVKNEETGRPELSTKPFLERIAAKEDGPQTLVQLMIDVGNMPSPADPNLNLFGELLQRNGLDPARLPDLRKFAESGYKTQTNGNGIQTHEIDPDELAQIPEELREAYASLSQSERDLLKPYDGEDQSEIDLRTQRLEDRKIRLDNDKQKAEKDAKDKQDEALKAQKEEQQFNVDWFNETVRVEEESGGRILESFVNSLVTQAEMDEVNARSIANTVSLAVSGQGLDGKNSRAVLEKIGVKLDVDDLYKEWTENARNIAYFTKRDDKVGLQKELDKQKELERSLTVKGNKVVAALAKHFTDNRAAKIESTNGLLTASQTAAPHTNGTPAVIGSGPTRKRTDYSDEEWEKIKPFD